jgi:hypothetical protein
MVVGCGVEISGEDDTAVAQQALPGGDVMIIAQHSNKCLDVKESSLANGAYLYQWDCWGGGNQKWRLQ